jgi:cytochrome c oxidase assembly protein subunit 15
MPAVSFRRSPDHQPALAWFAAFATACVPVLPVLLGAFTTSIGAGMIYETWPFSNGSLNPPGWLRDPAQCAEHSHRLSAGFVGLLTLALAGWVWLADARGWLRRLALGAAGLVLVQALVGGLRVLLDDRHLDLLTPSVGRLFAMLHACLAQVFFCALLAVALGLSRPWMRGRRAPSGLAARRLGLVCCGLLLAQLVAAAVMRHVFAGLAIPTFPLATAAWHVFPQEWSFNVALNFLHTRVLAGLLCVLLPWFVLEIWRDRASGLGMRGAAAGLLTLLLAQVALGASVIWYARQPHVTTAHVVVGATTLAVAFGLTWWAHREVIEQPAALAAAATPAADGVLARV